MGDGTGTSSNFTLAVTAVIEQGTATLVNAGRCVRLAELIDAIPIAF
jgi:hypothetical protein